jgi:hypothetical protein
MQNRVIGPALKSRGRLPPPLIVRLLQWPILRSIPGRLVGLGIRPEHVQTPEAVGA